MGRGCAKRAAELMPGLPEILGNHLSHGKNRVIVHGPWNHMQMVTFPVKPRRAECNADKSNVVRHMRKHFEPKQVVPGWACIASPDIIRRSAIELRDMAVKARWKHVILPRPGCGAGELDWKDVEPILDQILDNRFYSITF
jgi:hypothetical protein